MIKIAMRSLFIAAIGSLVMYGYHTMIFMPTSYRSEVWQYAVFLFVVSLILYMIVLLSIFRRKTKLWHMAIITIGALTVPPGQLGFAFLFDNTPSWIVQNVSFVFIVYGVISFTEWKQWVNAYQWIKKTVRQDKNAKTLEE